jgi:hypothetical protein
MKSAGAGKNLDEAETPAVLPVEESGKLIRLRMIPTQIRHFKVNRASNADSIWLRDRLDRECRKLGGRVELTEDGELTLERSD